jgi:hypothetical protein
MMPHSAADLKSPFGLFMDVVEAGAGRVEDQSPVKAARETVRKGTSQVEIEDADLLDVLSPRSQGEYQILSIS